MIEYVIKIKRKTKSLPTDGWVWKMAWRDARNNFSRLFLFVASLITGIAAVVALDSLNHSLQQDIENNARELVGADLVVEGEKPYTDEMQVAFDSLHLPHASQIDMASMVLFLHNQKSRLIKLVAMAGDFPFYGKIETQPADAYEKMKQGGYAMLDETLASQYEVSYDDSLRVGNSVFKVAGVVTRIAGGGGLMSTFTPSVYIDMKDLDSTRLIQFGSRVNYNHYYKIGSEERVEEIVDEFKGLVRSQGYSYDTVQERKEGLGR
ncbi:MAG: ABC transporter permease, partial [Cyclobacteriaceae bacterium]